MFPRFLAISTLGLLVATGLAGCFGGGKDSGGAPVASFKVDPGTGAGSFVFDASASRDADGDALEYWWNFGDNSEPVEGRTVEYQYVVTDTVFTASLVVRDGSGLADATTQEVTLGQGKNAAPEAHMGDANRWVKPGETIVLDATASDDHDGDKVSFEWFFGKRVMASETAKGPDNACATPSEDSYVFSTACLTMGQARNQTFGEPGVYFYHCHPHPWMKARVVVAADAQLTGTMDIPIRNFQFNASEVRVQPGSTIRWINEDPVAHTATAEWFTPGDKVSATPVLSVTPGPGDYVARLFVNDFKGGLISQPYGIRVSSEAPQSPTNQTFTKSGTAPQLSTDTAGQERWYNLSWRTKIDAGFDWNDPGGLNQVQASFDFVVVDDTGKPTALDNCKAVKVQFDAEKKSNIICTVDPGNYKFRVRSESGPLTEWTINVYGYPFATPGFGDSSGEVVHHH